MLRRKRFWFGLIISLSFLSIFLVRTDFAEIWEALSGADYALAVAAIPLYFVGFWVRTTQVAQVGASATWQSPGVTGVERAGSVDDIFWGNLDGLTGPSEYQKHGTGGDAKGQPTQTNSISHGSPWLLIRKTMVGAAFD